MPSKITLNCSFSYHSFRKKGFRISPRLEINFSDTILAKYANKSASHIAKILKAFKTLKYISELDLSQMVLLPRSFYLSKVLYLAKRMSNSHIILINDLKRTEDEYKGVIESCAKYIRKAKSFDYCFGLWQMRLGPQLDPLNASKNGWRFISLLNRHQPSLKELTIRFSSPFLSQGFWKFEKYPHTLEKLSLISPTFDNAITSSLAHLKNLKCFEIDFHPQTKIEFAISLLQLLPPIASQLKSLTLNLPGNQLLHRCPALAELNNNLTKLTQLKLQLNCSKFNSFYSTFKAFKGCPLKHLTLIAIVESEEQLGSFAKFIKIFESLKCLKLILICQNVFAHSENTQEILRQIDNLSLLETLSVSIISQENKNNPKYPELPLTFNKIFTKSVPLKVFKIQVEPLNKMPKQDFFQLINGLAPHASTLIKLRVNVGQYKPDKSEFQTVLDFIQSLKNIRSLELDCLAVPLRKFFSDIADIIYQMPDLRNLILGEVKGTVTKQSFVEIVKRILKKRGLKKFDCHTSHEFYYSLASVDSKIDLAEIQKINPSINQTPPRSLPIFKLKKSQPKLWS